MKISPLQIQDLETVQDLSAEELSPVQGGRSIGAVEAIKIDFDKIQPSPKGRIAYPHPRPRPFPIPRPFPHNSPPWSPRPICTNFPTKGGHLPWCAVIL